MIAAAPRQHTTTRVLPRGRVRRLRLVIVAALGVAALLGLSLLSMRVAAARSRLADADLRIAAVQRDYDALATGYDIRSRVGAQANWNAAGLALRAPKANQYLAGLGQLQSLARPVPPANELAMR